MGWSPGLPTRRAGLLTALFIVVFFWGAVPAPRCVAEAINDSMISPLSVPGRATPPAAGTPEDSSSMPEITGILRTSNEPPLYSLRGDWQAPDLLLLAYEDEWREALDGIVDAAREQTEVVVMADSEDMRDIGLWLWMKDREVSLFETEFDTPWVRDYGPLQVHGLPNEIFWLDLHYAADRPADDIVSYQLGRHVGVPVLQREFYLEGGGLISNGNGLCAMTDRTLGESTLDPLDTGETDRFLRDVGCRVMAVLPSLKGEDTGHVDMLGQFAGPDVVVLAEVERERDPGIAADLDHAESILTAAARLMGRHLTVIRVPLVVRGARFYSYINGTRLDRSFLVPHYEAVDQRLEQDAYERLAAAMPGIALVPIPSDSVIESGGAVHCVTLGLNLPSAVKLARHRTPPGPRRGSGTAGAGRQHRS